MTKTETSAGERGSFRSWLRGLVGKPAPIDGAHAAPRKLPRIADIVARAGREPSGTP